MKMNYPIQKEKNSEIPIKNCPKFNSFYHNLVDSEQAIIYIKLVKEGCPKKIARQFCSKAICKVDDTQLIDGPTNFRILKRKKEKAIRINGWNLNPPSYDLGNNLFQNVNNIIDRDDQEDLLKKHFISNEDKIREDFKKKIKMLSDYYKNLNDNYGFSQMEKKNLYKKIRQINEINASKNEKGKHFLNCNEIKLYSIGEELYSERNQENKKNIINELNIFPSFGNPLEENKFEVESENESQKSEIFDIYDVHSPIINSATTRTPRLSTGGERKKIISRKSIINNLNLKDKNELEKVKRKSSVFYDLEAQSNYLNSIANIENVMDQSHYSQTEARLLRKSGTSILKLQDNKQKKSIMMENLNKETKKYIEEEFNLSKYLTSKSPKNDKLRLSIQKSPLKNTRRTGKKSYLGDIILKKDLTDPYLFEEALKKIEKNHIDHLNNKKYFNKKCIDTKILKEIEKERIKTQENYNKKTNKYFYNTQSKTKNYRTLINSQSVDNKNLKSKICIKIN